MQIEITEALSNSLAGPINHAVSSANGAQFALMLSLVFEAQVGQKTEWGDSLSVPQQTTPSIYASIPLKMNQTLAMALQSANGAAFNLINALYGERQLAEAAPEAADMQNADYPQERDRRGKQAPMLETIDISKQYADRLSAD